jgi:hypothetical protein
VCDGFFQDRVSPVPGLPYCFDYCTFVTHFEIWSVMSPTSFFLIKIAVVSWVPVAHTCNPNYSGGRDLQNHG